MIGVNEIGKIRFY